jgi:hypothetical protein
MQYCFIQPVDLRAPLVIYTSRKWTAWGEYANFTWVDDPDESPTLPTLFDLDEYAGTRIEKSEVPILWILLDDTDSCVIESSNPLMKNHKREFESTLQDHIRRAFIICEPTTTGWDAPYIGVAMQVKSCTPQTCSGRDPFYILRLELRFIMDYKTAKGSANLRLRQEFELELTVEGHILETFIWTQLKIYVIGLADICKLLVH